MSLKREKGKEKEEQRLRAQRDGLLRFSLGFLRFALAVDTPTPSVKASSESRPPPSTNTQTLGQLKLKRSLAC